MWVPPQYQQAREEFEAEMRQRLANGELLRVKGILDEFNHELRSIDGSSRWSGRRRIVA
jgi:hypothetical protein